MAPPPSAILLSDAAPDEAAAPRLVAALREARLGSGDRARRL